MCAWDSASERAEISTTAKLFEGVAGAGARSKAGQSAVEDVLATPEGAQLASLFGGVKTKRVRQRRVELVRAMAAEA